MAQAQSDATSEPQQDSQNSQSSILKIGIFNAEADSAIANRLLQKLPNECESTRFDFLVAGESKIQSLQDFITSQDVLIWIATETSVKNDNMMRAYREIGQYASINSDGPQFIVFQPEEHRNVKLPVVLRAHTPLIEDNNFSARLASSIKSWLKKKSKREKKARARGHTADGSDADSSQQNPLAGIAPVSDNAMEISTTHYDVSSSVELEATPDQPKSSSNETPSANVKTEKSMNITVNFTNCTIQQVNIAKDNETETSTTDQKSKKQDEQNKK